MRVLVLASLAVSSSAAYPATFPFDTTTWGELPENQGYPDFSFSAEDGGYIRYALSRDYDDYEYPGFAASFDTLLYFPYFHYGFDMNMESIEALAVSKKNCTLTTAEIDLSVLEVIDGKNMCTECCTKLFKAEDYLIFTDFAAGSLAYFESVPQLGVCDTPNEFVVCLYTIGNVGNACFQNYLSSAERTVTKPCYDFMAMFQFSCKTYQVAGYPDRKYDIEAYYLSMSPAEQGLMMSVFHAQDKVCYPYSYYFPDSVLESEDTENILEEDDVSQSPFVFHVLGSVTLMALI